MKRIGVLTESSIVYNKIRLLLRGECEVDRLREGDGLEGYALVLADVGIAPEGAITLGDGGDIPLPFRHEDILAVVGNADSGPEDYVRLRGDGRHAEISGRRVRLTEVEYKLLARLIRADGLVSREELLESVWGEGFDAGVVNVYVYYLRKKLEKDGKKVIISSRGEGYGIDEKYRRKG